MGSPYRSFPSGYSSSGLITPGVKWLLISNTAIFVFSFLGLRFGGITLDAFKLVPEQVFSGAIWQLLTYQFLHDVHGFSHILFNMASLFFTGPMLESTWGTNRFLRYYLLCGIGAGLIVVLVSVPFQAMDSRTIGCSGSLFGLLIAYGVLFPDILFFGAIKAKYFVMIFGAMSLLGSLDGGNGGVSYVAHLGGMIVGYALIRSGVLRSLGNSRSRFDPMAWAEDRYKSWKLHRARRKFQVYMKRKGGPDPFDRENR